MNKPLTKVNNGLHDGFSGATKRVKNAAETRGRLLTAARQAFSEVGYHRATLREIADAAGVNLALVQRYFGGKDGLYEEALKSVMQPDLLIPADISRFGHYMAELLTTEPVETLRMMLASLSSLDATNTSLQLLRDMIYEPLKLWLGEPMAEERAQKILMLCSGFVVHTRLLPLEEPESTRMRDWLRTSLQAVVDEC